jgi:hypothetical protein
LSRRRATPITRNRNRIVHVSRHSLCFSTHHTPSEAASLTLLWTRSDRARDDRRSTWRTQHAPVQHTSAAFTEQHSKRTQEYEHTKEGSADDRRRIYSKKPRINGSSVQTAGKTPQVTA